MPENISFGGQAVIEGVMMRAPSKYAISVRKPNNEIVTKIVDDARKPSLLTTLPLFRGTFKLIETISIGYDAITFSANESGEENEKLSGKEMGVTLALGIIMTILLFYVAPLLLARFFMHEQGNFLFNIADGVFRLLIFLGYLVVLSMVKDIRRIFEYHGAEHKVVNCFEAGEKLTVKNVRKHPTSHPRCGTTFLLLVFTVSVLVFSVVPFSSLAERLAIRLLFLPVVAGISYEALKFSAKHKDNAFIRAAIKPGLLLQRLTTREPDDSQIEVGIRALKAVL